MKIKVTLTFVALFISIMSPLSMNISPSYEAPCIITLDICNASGNAVSANLDTPVVHESSYQLSMLEFTGSSAIILSPVLNLFLITIQKDRPPKV